MNKSFSGLLCALGLKLTRWDAVSFLIFVTLAFVAVEGCKMVASLQYHQILTLLVVLFALAFLGFFVEVALKRLL